MKQSPNITSRLSCLIVIPFSCNCQQSAAVSLYSGKYGDAVSLKTLKDFHRRRLQILAKSGADLIAFETIPNKLEAKVVNIFLNYTNELVGF